MIKKLCKVILCMLCVTQMLPTDAIMAVDTDFEIIDDYDERFNYSSGNANNGGWESYGEGSPEITEHWSNTAGATVKITFEGTKLELYGKKHPTHAMFRVSIDGNASTECDAYAADVDKEAKLYESTELTNGKHVAEVTVLNKRNSASTGSGSVYGVQFVYAKAYQTSNLPKPLLSYDFDDETASDRLGTNHGTLINQPKFSESRTGLGKALDTSTGGYVELPDSVVLGDKDFTVAFFVKAKEEKNDTVLFGNKTGDSGKDDGFSIMNYDGVFGNVGHDNVRYDTSANDRDKSVLDGTWRHVVVSAQRDENLSLYVDGVLSNKNSDFKTLAGIAMDTGEKFVLGAGNTGKYLQQALFDDLKIYPFALSKDDVMNLYASYGNDTQKELDEAVALLTDTQLQVSLSADQTMKHHAVESHVKTILSQYKNMEILVEVQENEQYLVSLKKAGITVNKTLTFTFIEKDVLTVATYNIYGWGYPSMKDINDRLQSIDADIVGLQEANYQTNGSGQGDQLVAQGSYPYSAFKAGYGTDTIWGGSTIVSKYPLQDKGGENYKVNDRTNRSFVRSTIQVGDKRVALYNTHIVWLEDPQQYAEYKAAQIQELIEAVEKDENPYKIIMGDFNTDQSTEELDQMLLHFNSANGWNNEWRETCDKDDSMKIGSVDQIFTTTNMEFVSIDVEDGGHSDHDVLYTSLKFKDDNTLPRQLLDNALLEADTYIKNADAYETSSIQQLRTIVEQIKEEMITKDSIYPNVKKLRTAISSLEKVMEPIKNPILYYDFNQADAKDTLGTYDGTMMNTPTFEEGKFGNALVTGEGYVALPEQFQLGKKDFSISYWFKSKEEKQDTILFSNKSGDSGNGAGLFLCNYDGLYANVGTGTKRYDTSSYDRDKTAMDGEWHYITVTADRSDALSLYVDGTLSSSNKSFKEIEDMLMDTEDAYVIGAGSQGGYKQKANIDEFKIYDYALDAQQIQYLYKQYAAPENIAKVCLQRVIETAQTFVKSDDFKVLAPSVQALIQKQLSNALAVYATQASDEQYVDAWFLLANALHYAGFKADKAMLKTLIAECKSIDLSNYVEGVEIFEQALAKAKEVYENNNVLQESIDTAYDALLLAKSGLIEKPTSTVNKKQLEMLIQLTKGTLANKDQYVQNDAWKAFEDALANAESIMVSEDADQVMVDQASLVLSNAYENIRFLPNEELLKQLQEFLQVTAKIDRRLFNHIELAMIDGAVAIANTMLTTKDFTDAQFEEFTKTMHVVTTMIKEKQTNENVKPDDSENTNQQPTSDEKKAPKTYDTTKVAGFTCLLLVSMGILLIGKKHKAYPK